jgi:hypothetical protein
MVVVGTRRLTAKGNDEEEEEDLPQDKLLVAGYKLFQHLHCLKPFGPKNVVYT